MSDYLNPIMNEADLLSYENFFNDISKEANSINKINVFEELIGKRINIKVSTDTGLCSYFGTLKKATKEYLELCQKDGKKVLVLKPEKIISITLI